MEIFVAAICLAIGIGIGRWTKRGSRTSAEETQRLQGGQDGPAGEPPEYAAGRSDVRAGRHRTSATDSASFWPRTSIDGLARRFRCRSITPVSDKRGRIGIDVGGTFTDAVIVVDDGRHPHRQGALDARADRGRVHGRTAPLLERAGAAAADVGYLAHGSTVATNAIVQRRLARTAADHQRRLPRRARDRDADARARLRPVDAGARADRPPRAAASAYAGASDAGGEVLERARRGRACGRRPTSCATTTSRPSQ